MDENIAKLMILEPQQYTNQPKSCFNKYYFFPEIKPFLNNENKTQIEKYLLQMNENIFEEFESKRKIGENDSYICKLIREDSVEEFDIYINKTNLSLSSHINECIFETNRFLSMKENVSLIEYSAFFGSIQIFQYLRLKEVQLTSSLWLYVIHSNNPELIHILEEDHIKPENEDYLIVLEEAIKCHHNSIANYFIENYQDSFVNMKNYVDSYAFHYHNYEYIDDDYKSIVSLACKYGYFTIVKLLFESKDIDVKKNDITFNILFLI